MCERILLMLAGSLVVLATVKVARLISRRVVKRWVR
mgnify:CR=1 FL=1